MARTFWVPSQMAGGVGNPFGDNGNGNGNLFPRDRHDSGCDGASSPSSAGGVQHPHAPVNRTMPPLTHPRRRTPERPYSTYPRLGGPDVSPSSPSAHAAHTPLPLRAGTSTPSSTGTSHGRSSPEPDPAGDPRSPRKLVPPAPLLPVPIGARASGSVPQSSSASVPTHPDRSMRLNTMSAKDIAMAARLSIAEALEAAASPTTPPAPAASTCPLQPRRGPPPPTFPASATPPPRTPSPPVSPASKTMTVGDAPAPLEGLHPRGDDAEGPSGPSGFRVPQPTTKQECFTRYIFPTVPATPPTPLSGRDVSIALERLHACASPPARRGTRAQLIRSGTPASPAQVHVQFHAGVSRLLLCTLNRLSPPPSYDPPASRSEERFAEWYALSLRDWAARAQDAHATPRQSHELLACHDAFAAVIEPLNDFLADRFNFELGHRRRVAARWGWPAASLASCSGSTDWVAFTRGASTPRALVKWRHGISDEQMQAVAAASFGGAREGDHPIDVLPGFSIGLDREGQAVIPDNGIGSNGISACLLAWSDAHHYRTRWIILCNGRSALVFFLAKPNHLFVGPFIAPDAGSTPDSVGLTLATALFALAVLPADARPTVSMSDDALMWYSPPPHARTSSGQSGQSMRALRREAAGEGADPGADTTEEEGGGEGDEYGAQGQESPTKRVKRVPMV